MATLTMRLAQRIADDAQPPRWQRRWTVRPCTEMLVIATFGFPRGEEVATPRRAGRRGSIVRQACLRIGGPQPPFTERMRTTCEECLASPAGIGRTIPGRGAE